MIIDGVFYRTISTKMHDALVNGAVCKAASCTHTLTTSLGRKIVIELRGEPVVLVLREGEHVVKIKCKHHTFMSNRMSSVDQPVEAMEE